MIEFASTSLHLVHPSGAETELFFVRHGQTSANVRHQFAGFTDVPLDELGRRQADQVAARFKQIEIDSIISSPLQRAHYTAERIGNVSGHTPIVMDGLKEMNFGDAEMLTYPEIIANWPTLLDPESNKNLSEFRWPNGESDVEFLARILATMGSVMQDYQNQRVAVVCHGGVISNVLNHLHGGDRDGFMQFSIANCSITHLQVSKEQTTVHYWNDHAHLDEVMGPLLAE